MPKVTVAMASYNHESFVGEAIESVLSQNDCDFELSIVDDGSTDSTLAQIQKFRDPRLKYIGLKKNEGACVALRYAIESGTGEYIAILNSDDAFLPDKLSRQVAFLDAHPEVHALFGYPVFVNAKGDRLTTEEHFYKDLFYQPNRSRYEWLRYFFYRTNALCHPTLMIRRICYQDLGYYDPRMAQLPDLDFWVRLCLKYNIHILQEELLRFRILPNEANISANTLENDQRAGWELTYILPHFLKLSLKEYIQVFPEDQELWEKFKENEASSIIPYALAQKALTLAEGYLHPCPRVYQASYRFFGLQTLFKLFEDNLFQTCIAPRLGTNLSQLTRIAKQYPIFYRDPSPLQPLFTRAWALIKEAGHKIKHKWVKKAYAKLRGR